MYVYVLLTQLTKRNLIEYISEKSPRGAKIIILVIWVLNNCLHHFHSYSAINNIMDKKTYSLSFINWSYIYIKIKRTRKWNSACYVYLARRIIKPISAPDHIIRKGCLLNFVKISHILKNIFCVLSTAGPALVDLVSMSLVKLYHNFYVQLIM